MSVSIFGVRGGRFGAGRALREAVLVHLYAENDATGRQAAAGALQLGLPLHSFGTAGSTPLRPGTAYLVRPDGFVVAVSSPDAMVGAFRTAMMATCGPGTVRTLDD